MPDRCPLDLSKVILVVLFLAVHISAYASGKDSILLVIDTTSSEKIRLQAKVDFAGILVDESLYDSTSVLLHQVIEEAESKALIVIAAEAYELLGYTHDVSGNLKKSIAAYEEAIKRFKDVGDKIAVARCTHYQGVSSYFQGDYEKALAFYLKSIELSEGLDRKSGMANTLNNIGVIYRITNKNREAAKFYHQGLELNKELGNREGVAQQHNNLGVAYTYLYNLDSALLYLDSAMLYYQMTQDTYDIAFTYNSYGDAYYEAGKDLDNARVNLLNANELFKVSSSQFSLAKNYLFLGKVELEDGHPERSLSYVEQGLQVLEGTDREDIRLDLKYAAYQAHEQLDQPSQALMYLKDYLALYKKLRAEEKLEYIEEMQTKYDTEQKEKRIEIQNLELGQQQRDKRALRIIMALLLAGLLSSAIFIRSNLSKNKALSAQKKIIESSLRDKDMLLKEIHHRVKNNLQIISSILTLQGRYSDDPLVESAIKKGKDRVKSMALIHQNLYQKNNFAGVNIKEYFEKLFKNLFDSYNIQGDRIKLQLDLEEINLDVDTVVPIGLIVNELVSNSLKYAFPEDRAGLITVNLREENGRLILRVTDDGIGMQDVASSQVKSGFGLELVEAFKVKLGAELLIRTEQGTEITMSIEKYRKVA